MSKEKKEYKLHWRCRQCGQNSPITAEYCCNPLCGADLKLYGEQFFDGDVPPKPKPWEIWSSEPEDEKNEETDEKNDNTTKGKGGLLFVVAALAVLLILLLIFFRPTPVDPVSEQETVATTESQPLSTNPIYETTVPTTPPETTVPVTSPATSAPTIPPEITVPVTEITTPPVTEETVPQETILEEILDGFYTGPVRDGKPEGEGQLTWPGGTYIGDFSDGYPEGSGTFLYDDGAQVKSDHWSYGSGDYPYPVGKLQGTAAGTYTGLKKDGEFYGHGQLQLDVGSCYSGIFYAGQPYGEGAFRTEKGRTISGNWNWAVNLQDSLDSSRSGSTVSYTGMTCNGTICGFGTLTLDKCGTFYGEFMDGEANGSGLYAYRCYLSEDDAIRYGKNWGMVRRQYIAQFEHTYTGLVLNGTWEGLGLGIKNSGSHYVGEIKDYHRHGYGRIYLKDNSLYQEGFIINDKLIVDYKSS